MDMEFVLFDIGTLTFGAPLIKVIQYHGEVNIVTFTDRGF